jgi:predicted hydrocarbon binding protein
LELTDMQIKNKAEGDATADLLVVDAYLRWALQAAEEVVGKNGLTVVLREAGLAHLIDHFPTNELKASGSLTYRDYAGLNTGLLSFYGRAGKGMALRMGRLSAKHAIEQQAALFGLAALLASKLLPVATQLKMGLEAQQSGLKKLAQSIGQNLRMRVEDRGAKLAYINEDCAACAGKTADEHICWIITGVLEEGLRWQIGKEFEIAEVECKATGAPACVWEIAKKPKS